MSRFVAPPLPPSPRPGSSAHPDPDPDPAPAPTTTSASTTTTSNSVAARDFAPPPQHPSRSASGTLRPPPSPRPRAGAEPSSPDRARHVSPDENADADESYFAGAAMPGRQPPPIRLRTGSGSGSGAGLTAKQEKEKKDEELTYAELRKLYEDEEIERFLALFASNVQSVRLGDPAPLSPSSPGSSGIAPEVSPFTAHLLHRFIPLLPRQPGLFSQDPREPFSLAKLQQNAVRLYVFYPAYARWAAGVWRVAIWKDKWRSAEICTVYWLLWWFDLLLPSLFLRILYSLIRRRFLPYPSLAELRAHRAAAAEAAQFGEAAKLNYQGAGGLGLAAWAGGGGEGGLGLGLGLAGGVLAVTELLGWDVAWRRWRESRRGRKVAEKVEREEDGVDREVEREMAGEGDARAGVPEEEDGAQGSVLTLDTDSLRVVDEETETAATSTPSIISPSMSVDSLQSSTSTSTSTSTSISTTAPSASTAGTASSELGKLAEKERKRAEKLAAQAAVLRKKEALRELKAQKAALKEADRARRLAQAGETKTQKLAEDEESKRLKEAERARRKQVKMEERRRKAEEREKKREEDWRKAVMVALGEIADLHERIKNMFLWRNPAASRVYAGVIFGLFLFTFLTPARYIAKLIYFLVGFVFFFLIPFIRAMPPKAKARMPPSFSDVPTDAQYAYGLIRERAARGESLVPVAKDAKGKAKDPDTLSLSSMSTPLSPKFPGTPATLAGDTRAPDWERLIHRGWAFAEDSRRLLRGEPILSAVTSAEGVSSFPAQHAGTVGTMSISATELWFTPLSGREVRVALGDIAGVRKTGAMGLGGGKWGGLEIRLRAPEEEQESAEETEETMPEKGKGAAKEKEENGVHRFPFVGKRNEAFALLVAWSGQNWLRT